MHTHALNLPAAFKRKHDQNLRRLCEFKFMCCHRCHHSFIITTTRFINRNHQTHQNLFFFFFLIQWGFHNDRSILGHQPGPSWLIHTLLAPQPRRRRQHSERREPPVGVYHAHRLLTQVQPPSQLTPPGLSL